MTTPIDLFVNITVIKTTNIVLYNTTPEREVEDFRAHNRCADLAYWREICEGD